MILFKPFKSTYLFLFLLMNFQLISCAQSTKEKSEKKDQQKVKIIKTGAENTHLYLNLLKGKNIAIVANHTSVLSVLQRAEIAPNVFHVPGVQLETQTTPMLPPAVGLDA